MDALCEVEKQSVSTKGVKGGTDKVLPGVATKVQQKSAWSFWGK